MVLLLSVPACGDESSGSTGNADASGDSSTFDGASDASEASLSDASNPDDASSNTDSGDDASGPDASLAMCSEPNDTCCQGGVCGGDTYCLGQNCSCIRTLQGSLALLASGHVAYYPGAERLIELESSGQPLSDVVEIFDGHWHGCALRSDQTVWCWAKSTSANAAGELGNGTLTAATSLWQATQVMEAPDNPDDPATPLTGAVHLPSGSSASYLNLTTCAIMSDGGLRCWGATGNGGGGQVFNDGESGARPLATKIYASEGTLLSGVEQVSMGRRHYCALRNGGEVWCWGTGIGGAVGQGGTGNQPEQVYPARVALPGMASEVGASSDFSCALVAGAVHCWGSSSGGRLGIGDFMSDENHDGCINYCKTSPGEVIDTSDAPLSDVADLEVTYLGVCAIKNDASLHCWGSDIGLVATPLEVSDSPVQNVSILSSFGSGNLSAAVRYLTGDNQFFVGNQLQSQPCEASVMP